MEQTLLEVNNVTKAFGGVLALKDLTFHVKRGQLKAIIGPNGAGGRGTIWGSLLGAVIVTMLPEFMYVFRTYTTLFYGIVFVLILTLLPMSLAGIIRSVMARSVREDVCIPN